MPVDRRQDARFSSDKDYSQRAARRNLQLDYKYRNNLLKFRYGNLMLQKFEEFYKQAAPFTDEELSKIDKYHEYIWKGLGFDSVNTHVDKKRRGAGL